MNAFHIVKQLWEHLAGRSRSATPRVQRLSGFEPLEPRTVLSASGMTMFGGFAGPHHNDGFGFEPTSRQFSPGGDFDSHHNRQPTGGDRFFTPPTYDAAPPDAMFSPRGYGDMAFRPPPPQPMTPVTDLGARPASAGGASTTLTIITVYVPSNAVFSPDIIVQRSPNTTRLTTEFNSGLSLVDNRLFAPIVSITSAERRAEGQPSGSNASLRESAIRSLEARLTSSSAVTTEADEAVKAAEHALSQRSANSPTLGLLSFVSAVATDPSASVRSDDEGRLDERPSGQSAAGGSRGDEDGMIELSSADVLRQKRKAAASDSLARASSSPRLQRLAELPLLRDIQSLFSDLARLADENLRTASIDQQTSYVDESDDGMVELLAADVGSLMLPTASPTADAQSIAAARAMTLDAGLAIYQAFEIAQPDSATSDAPTDATPQVDVPAAEQLARVE